MANQLGGFTVSINGRAVQVNYFPSLSLGLTSGGIFVPMLVDSTGALVVDTSGGAGGGSNVAITSPLGAQTAAASVATVGARVTAHPAAIGASGSVTFPVGAQDCSFLLLTGTGTVGGVNWPLLTPYNVRGPLAATLTVATGSTSSAICDYSS